MVALGHHPRRDRGSEYCWIAATGFYRPHRGEQRFKGQSVEVAIELEFMGKCVDTSPANSKQGRCKITRQRTAIAHQHPVVHDPLHDRYHSLIHLPPTVLALTTKSATAENTPPSPSPLPPPPPDCEALPLPSPTLPVPPCA